MSVAVEPVPSPTTIPDSTRSAAARAARTLAGFSSLATERRDSKPGLQVPTPYPPPRHGDSNSASTMRQANQQPHRAPTSTCVLTETPPSGPRFHCLFQKRLKKIKPRLLPHLQRKSLIRHVLRDRNHVF